MRKIIIMLFVLIPAFAFAGGTDVTFEWDANTEQDLAGYKLYQDTDPIPDTTTDIWKAFHRVADVPAPATTVTLSDISDGVYYYRLTAYDNEDPPLESGYSNEVSARLDTTPPDPPAGLIITLLEKIMALLEKIEDRMAQYDNGFRIVPDPEPEHSEWPWWNKG